jgi:hypothetical protein
MIENERFNIVVRYGDDIKLLAIINTQGQKGWKRRKFCAISLKIRCALNKNPFYTISSSLHHITQARSNE